MKELKQIIIIQVIVTTLFLVFLGLFFGVFLGVNWKSMGELYCKQSYEKPRSYVGYVSYPFKYGQRIGCFLGKPRFN